MKTSIRSSIVGLLMTAAIVVSSVPTASAQSVGGRIAFGFDAGANKYWGDFADNQFGFSGDLFIRWNILDWLSLHGAYNGGILRYSTGSRNLAVAPNYFGQTNGGITGNGHYNNDLTQPLVEANGNTIRHGGWDIMLSANVFPQETFVPFVIAGVEMLNFAPKTADGGLFIPSNTPQTAVLSDKENVVGGVVGLGFEMYINPKVTFNSKLLLHLTGTDWLDGFSKFGGTGTQDVFMTFGLGFSYYVFAPAVVAEPVATTASTTSVTNIYETNIYHSDTVVVKSPTDTVYLRSLKVNTVVNFPATFFIVNTDDFNTSVPGNTASLYQIKALVNQCPNLQVEIQGFASAEGTPARNQELSEMRAAKIKSWLLAQGVDPSKITNTVGYGARYPMVQERTDVSAAELESERAQNRRIAVRVVRACN